MHEEILVAMWLTTRSGSYMTYASVQQGFSINKDGVVENQKERSLVTYRIVFDAVLLAGVFPSIQLAKKMLQMVRGANVQ